MIASFSRAQSLLVSWNTIWIYKFDRRENCDWNCFYRCITHFPWLTVFMLHISTTLRFSPGRHSKRGLSLNNEYVSIKITTTIQSHDTITISLACLTQKKPPEPVNDDRQMADIQHLPRIPWPRKMFEHQACNPSPPEESGEIGPEPNNTWARPGDEWLRLMAPKESYMGAKATEKHKTGTRTITRNGYWVVGTYLGKAVSCCVVVELATSGVELAGLLSTSTISKFELTSSASPDTDSPSNDSRQSSIDI